MTRPAVSAILLRNMAASRIHLLPNDTWVTVSPGQTILQAAAAGGLRLHTPCGGQGRCGKCAVQILSGATQAAPAEEKVFSAEELATGWRLACTTRAAGDMEVAVPPASLLVEHRIMVEGVGREIVVEPGVQKVGLRLPPPSVDDPRSDLQRVLDALGGHVRADQALRSLRELPRVLRADHYHVTAVVAGDVIAGLEPGDTTELAYGVAVDIGTTTVVAYLCHLPTGTLAAVASALNPQSQYGEDVVSRLRLATSDEGGLEQLRSAIIGALNDLIGQAAQEAGIARESIYELAVVGNTSMSHFLLGVPPVGLTALPFVPVFRRAQWLRAGDLGIAINPGGRIYVAPSIGGFVGADTVGVILASELDQSDGLRVAVDIGTNGEIVVAKDGDIYACSTAAGPAFEGARISQGMRAAVGAIDEVWIGEEIAYHVIGDARPKGLCGSGLVDAVAGLLRLGVIEESGRLRRPEEVKGLPEKVRPRLIQNQAGAEFVLAPGEESGTGKPVTITARDVRELQLAKGAIYAGIALLLEEVGHAPLEVERLLLAGAFGNYIRRESAAAIGLIPALPLDRIQPIGNAAGLGARLMLCSVSLRRQAQEIAARVRHIELAEREGFYDRFAEAMALRPMPRGE
jgi:uncharacterized 2Fe-2S/4Fe-4S cluster protein (DUF4445 family)